MTQPSAGPEGGSSEPSWRFWHPLPFWRVLLIFAGAQVIAWLLFVLLRQGLGVAIPYGAGGGAGGLLGMLAVTSQASKLRARRDGAR